MSSEDNTQREDIPSEDVSEQEFPNIVTDEWLDFSEIIPEVVARYFQPPVNISESEQSYIPSYSQWSDNQFGPIDLSQTVPPNQSRFLRFFGESSTTHSFSPSDLSRDSSLQPIESPLASTSAQQISPLDTAFEQQRELHVSTPLPFGTAFGEQMWSSTVSTPLNQPLLRTVSDPQILSTLGTDSRQQREPLHRVSSDPQIWMNFGISSNEERGLPLGLTGWSECDPYSHSGLTDRSHFQRFLEELSPTHSFSSSDLRRDSDQEEIRLRTVSDIPWYTLGTDFTQHREPLYRSVSSPQIWFDISSEEEDESQLEPIDLPQIDTSPQSVPTNQSRFQRFFGESSDTHSFSPSELSRESPSQSTEASFDSDLYQQILSTFDTTFGQQRETSFEQGQQTGSPFGSPFVSPQRGQQLFSSDSAQQSHSWSPYGSALGVGDWASDILSTGTTYNPQFTSLEEELQKSFKSETNEYVLSSSIEEDIQLMAKKGFIIESTDRSRPLPNVLQGMYGFNIINEVNIRGVPFELSFIGKPFIVKFIENKSQTGISDLKREMFKIERSVLTMVNHPNIVSLMYTFDMGTYIKCKYRNNLLLTFNSWDRMYNIMEFADLGDLENYMENNYLSQQLCISFIKQLYFGLKYLHESNIFHCDIEPRNVLLFKANGPNITVKWCDFGNSAILDANHPSQGVDQPIITERIVEYCRFDLQGLSLIYQQILMYSDLSNGEPRKYIQQIIDGLSSGTDLNQIKFIVEMLNFYQ